MGQAQKNKIKIIKQIDLTHHFNEDVLYLFKIFENIGANLWVVGGAVRDILLGKEYSDVDFVTDIDSEKIQKQLSSNGRFSLIDYAKKYGCITFKSKTNNYHVTSMREDVKSYGRNADTRHTKNILIDAKRRDFTINAFYIGRQGEVLDPLGAYDDMLKSKVCFIGDVSNRIEEDNLRILRFLRFAVIFNNRKINLDELKICIQLRHLILNLSKDRVRDEVLKIISSIQSPEMIKYLSINKFFSILNFQINSFLYQKKISQIKEEIDFEFNPIIYFALALDPNLQKKLLMDAVKELNFSKKEFYLIHKIYNFNVIELYEFDDLIDFYLYKHGRYLTKIFLIKCLINSNIVPTDWTKSFIDIDNKPIPIFPISANTLIEVGFKDGKVIGKTLSELEKIWLSSKCLIDKEGLLNSIDLPTDQWGK
ncbi:MAG: hypothetical protein CML81_07275 [Rhodobiaceae bacterium]|nr:hypothetical protein [Rhodobiaceae bacterium]RPF96074.1 MAG: CCA tRNA nucleotidyltransferase [Rhizobiales bacterium TMED227]